MQTIVIRERHRGRCIEVNSWQDIMPQGSRKLESPGLRREDSFSNLSPPDKSWHEVPFHPLHFILHALGDECFLSFKAHVSEALWELYRDLSR